MPIVNTSKKAWIIDFPLMGSNGAESLGKRLMLVIMASVMASNVPGDLL